MGTSFNDKVHACLPQDHPHACGDKAIVLLYSVIKVGSSPRVWGQVNGGENKNEVEGIIPTRVGTRKSEIDFLIRV